MLHKKNNSIPKNSIAEQDDLFLHGPLKSELKAYFHSFHLSADKKHALEALLLNPVQTQALAKPRAFLQKVHAYSVRNFLSHFLTAAAAVVLTFFVSTHFTTPHSGTQNHDAITAISEVASLSGNLDFPADFNLDGNLNDLPSFIEDAMPNHSFSPSVPKQIAAAFAAYEARFFLFKGDQGVGINVSPYHAKTPNFKWPVTNFSENKMASMLYIVKLSEKNRSSFPAHKTPHRLLSASGRVKKVYAWIEGTYGYAMVQNTADNEADNFPNALR